MTIFSTDASAGDSVARLVGDMFTDLSRVLLMSDDEMFAGLEARTVADLQQRLQEKPGSAANSLPSGELPGGPPLSIAPQAFARLLHRGHHLWLGEDRLRQ